MTLEQAILLYSRHSNVDFGTNLTTWPLYRRIRFLRSSGRREGVAQIDDSDIRAAYFMVMDASDDAIKTALHALNIDIPEGD